MADALDISISTEYDGPIWHVGDPVAVDVTVKKPDGTAVSSASVSVALVEAGTQVDIASGTTGTNGKVTLTLEASATGRYRIQSSAKTSARSGFVTWEGVLEAREAPPFSGANAAGSLTLLYNSSSNLISRTA